MMYRNNHIIFSYCYNCDHFINGRCTNNDIIDNYTMSSHIDYYLELGECVYFLLCNNTKYKFKRINSYNSHEYDDFISSPEVRP